MKLRGMTNVRANLCLLLISIVAGLCLCELCLRFFYPKYRSLAEPGLGQGAARIINNLHIPYLILDARGRLPSGEEVATEEKLRGERRSRVRAEGWPSNPDWKNNDERGTGPAVASGRRLIRPGFDVSIDGKRLIYSKAVCLPVDRQPLFFLHVTPVDENDLPESRVEYGFANLDFDPAGFRIDERECTIERQLPDYAIRHIRTGQYTLGKGRIWEGEFFVRQSIDAERSVGPAAASGRCLIRPGFDAYLSNELIFYVKEGCRPADREAPFFLRVTPVDENDLPESRVEYGFVNLDFDPTEFKVDERGCTIERRLPDYAIRHIRTGQYISGEGPIWEGVFFIQQRAGTIEGRLQWVEGEEMRYQVFIDPAVGIVSYGVEN